MRDATDVLVIGGGPAELAAAIAARKKGFSVTVADGATKLLPCFWLSDCALGWPLIAIKTAYVAMGVGRQK